MPLWILQFGHRQGSPLYPEGPSLCLKEAGIKNTRLLRGPLVPFLWHMEVSGLSSAVAPRLKSREETREKKGGARSGCPTALARRLLREDTVGPPAQMGKGRPFLPATLYLSFGCSARGEETVHLQITTPGAGLHLVTPHLEEMRYTQL